MRVATSLSVKDVNNTPSLFQLKKEEIAPLAKNLRATLTGPKKEFNSSKEKQPLLDRLAHLEKESIDLTDKKLLELIQAINTHDPISYYNSWYGIITIYPLRWLSEKKRRLREQKLAIQKLNLYVIKALYQSVLNQPSTINNLSKLQLVPQNINANHFTPNILLWKYCFNFAKNKIWPWMTLIGSIALTLIEDTAKVYNLLAHISGPLDIMLWPISLSLAAISGFMYLCFQGKSLSEGSNLSFLSSTLNEQLCQVYLKQMKKLKHLNRHLNIASELHTPELIALVSELNNRLIQQKSYINQMHDSTKQGPWKNGIRWLALILMSCVVVGSAIITAPAVATTLGLSASFVLPFIICVACIYLATYWAIRFKKVREALNPLESIGQSVTLLFNKFKENKFKPEQNNMLLLQMENKRLSLQNARNDKPNQQNNISSRSQNKSFRFIGEPLAKKTASICTSSDNLPISTPNHSSI